MTYLIFDSNAICHSVKFSMGDLSFEDMQTGVIFGFLKRMFSISKKTKITSFLFAWDSRRSKRKDLFPEYKYKRGNKEEKTAEEREEDKLIFAQFDAIRQDVLPALGFNNIFHQVGYEADDLIASIIKHDTDQNKFVIVTSDRDLYQLLSPTVKIFDIKTKKYYTEKNFLEEFAITPSQWTQVKEIGGCKTDEVPGIPGVAETGACQFVRGDLKPTSNKYKKIISSEYQAIRTRNRKLVTLPYPGTKPCEIQENQLSYSAFRTICENFDFQSLLYKETLHYWKSICEKEN